ncbi:phosphatase PAP2 family protein [Burkholderia anthina]|uniref:Phosphatase PAP2 family protein n=1 Tax=Burkholderia anthina TaxID=179879 RepID=A0A7T7AIN8_9BURK|nr:phosphatase PAP2 family protein [Burkholderia anthina]QQK04081.1 phosphatase PAP2 family protein [Burkholderia anthina]
MMGVDIRLRVQDLPVRLAWQIQHLAASRVVVTIYESYIPQALLTIAVLGSAKRDRDLTEFLLLFVGIAVVTVLLSAPFPASNPMIHFGLQGPYDDSLVSLFQTLRDGSLKAFDL